MITITEFPLIKNLCHTKSTNKIANMPAIKLDVYFFTFFSFYFLIKCFTFLSPLYTFLATFPGKVFNSLSNR